MFILSIGVCGIRVSMFCLFVCFDTLCNIVINANYKTVYIDNPITEDEDVN